MANEELRQLNNKTTNITKHSRTYIDNLFLRSRENIFCNPRTIDLALTNVVRHRLKI